MQYLKRKFSIYMPATKDWAERWEATFNGKEEKEKDEQKSS